MTNTSTQSSHTQASHRHVTPQQAVELFIKNMTNFEGRSSRGAYWWVMAANLCIAVAINMISSVIGLFSIVGMLVSLALLVPGIALSARRMHDVNRSAMWLLIAFVPLAGFVLLYWAAQPGTPGQNTFGPDMEAGREDAMEMRAAW